MRLVLAKVKSERNSSSGRITNAKARYGEIVPSTNHTGKNATGMIPEMRSTRVRVLGRFKSVSRSKSS